MQEIQLSFARIGKDDRRQELLAARAFADAFDTELRIF
jgi:hypothetical protein